MFDNHRFLEAKPELRERVKVVILEHLRNLRLKSDEYFPVDQRAVNAWIRDPFAVNIDDIAISKRLKSQLIELASDGSLQNTFKRESLTKFWVEAEKEYAKLGQAAVLDALLDHMALRSWIFDRHIPKVAISQQVGDNDPLCQPQNCAITNPSQERLACQQPPATKVPLSWNYPKT